MLEYLPEFMSIAILHLLAVMSPGPDFILVCNNSILYSRRSGVFTALGLALGILTHVTYSLIGIAYIISKSIIIFSTIKLLGAGYLIYLGWKILKSKSSLQVLDSQVKKPEISQWEAVKNGYLTNLLNPKVTIFFLAVFTQVVDADTPHLVKAVYGLEMSVMTFLWFACVAMILSHEKIKKPFAKVQVYLEKFMGTMLLALGIKVALSNNKS